jgi:hypothetical protein
MTTTARISLEDGTVFAESAFINIEEHPSGGHVEVTGALWLPHGTKYLGLGTTVNARLANGRSWKLLIRELTDGSAQGGVGYLFNAHSPTP